ncbi:MAG: hypothetical protein ACTHL8_07205 [Burkholderiaceae bacterium]
MTARRADDACRTLAWTHGRAEVQRLGAMLAPVTFSAPGRADFQPLHVAPWADEPGADALPGILRRLRGEWPCVPFGRADAPAALPPGWRALASDDAFGHGFASHHDWDWLETGDEAALALAIEPPGASPVRRLERRIAGVPGAPALAIELRIEARRPCALPAALHPTLRLDLGRVRVDVPHRGPVVSYPVEVAPDVSRLAVGATFDRLAQAPLREGGTVALDAFPLPRDAEELVQLLDADGPATIAYPDAGWTLALDWDRTLLPDVMLWVSHRGRPQAPWNGRHLALGVEPVGGVFDLGRVAAPPQGHPLAARRGLALDPARPCVLRYELRAAPARA